MTDIRELIDRCEKKFADAGLVSGSVSADGALAGAEEGGAVDLVCWVQDEEMLLLWPARCRHGGTLLADCEGHVLWRTNALSRLFHTLVEETAAHKARGGIMRAALEDFLSD